MQNAAPKSSRDVANYSVLEAKVFQLPLTVSICCCC